MPNLRDLGPTSGLPVQLEEQPSNIELLQATQGYTPSVADRIAVDADFERGLQGGAMGLRAGALYRDADKAELKGDIERANALRGHARQEEQIAASVAPRVGSTADVNSFGDALDFAQSGLGQLAPTMAATTLPAIAGAIVGGVLTGGNPLGAAAGASLAGGYSGFQMEAGEAASNQQSDEYIRSLPVEQRIREQNIKGMQAAAVELLFPTMVGGRIATSAKHLVSAAARQAAKEAAETAKRQTLRQHLGKAAKTVAQEGGVEAATEATQTMIGHASMSRLNPNRDTSNDYRELIDSTILGALGGGGMSLSTTVPGALAGAAKDGALRPIDPIIENTKARAKLARAKVREIAGTVAEKTAPARIKVSELAEEAKGKVVEGAKTARAKIKEADLKGKLQAAAEKAAPVVETAIDKASEVAKAAAVVVEEKVARGKQRIADAELQKRAGKAVEKGKELSQEAFDEAKKRLDEMKPTDEQQTEAKRQALTAWRKAKKAFGEASKKTGKGATAARVRAQKLFDQAQAALQERGGAAAVAKKGVKSVKRGAAALKEAGKKLKNDPEGAVLDAVDEVSARVDKLKADIDQKIADGTADETLKKTGERIGKLTKKGKTAVTKKFLEVQDKLEQRKRSRKSLLGMTGDDALITDDDMLNMAIEEAAADEDFVETSTKYQATAEEITGLRPLEPASGKEQAGQRTALRLHEPMYTTEKTGRKPFIKVRGAAIRDFLQKQVDSGVITQEVMNSAQIEPLGARLKREGASEQQMENELSAIVRDLVRRAAASKDIDTKKAIESELAQLPLNITRKGEEQTDSYSQVVRKTPEELAADKKKAAGKTLGVPAKDQGKLFPETDAETFPIPVSEFRKHHFGFSIDIAAQQGELELRPTRKEADAKQPDLFPNTLGDQYKLPTRQEAVIRALNKYGVPLVSDAAALESAPTPKQAKAQRRGLDTATQEDKVPESEKLRLKMKNGQTRIVHIPSAAAAELNAERETIEGGLTGRVDYAAIASAVAGQLMDPNVEGVLDAKSGKLIKGLNGVRAWLRKKVADPKDKMTQQDAASIYRALNNRARKALGQSRTISSEPADLFRASKDLAQVQREFKIAKAAYSKIDSAKKRAKVIKKLRDRNQQLRDNLSAARDLKKHVNEIIENMPDNEKTVVGELDKTTAMRLAELGNVTLEQVYENHKQLLADIASGKVAQGRSEREIRNALIEGLAPNAEVAAFAKMSSILQRVQREKADRLSALAQDLQEIQNEAVREGTQLQEQTRGRISPVVLPDAETQFLVQLTAGKVLGAKAKGLKFEGLDSRMRKALETVNLRTKAGKEEIAKLAKAILTERRKAKVTGGEETIGETDVGGEVLVTQAKPKSRLAADQDFDRKGKPLKVRHAEDPTGAGAQLAVGQGAHRGKNMTDQQLRENAAWTKRMGQLKRLTIRNADRTYFRPNSYGVRAPIVPLGKTAEGLSSEFLSPVTSVPNANGRQVALLIAPAEAVDVVETVEFHRLLATVSAIELLVPSRAVEQELKDAGFKKLKNTVWVPVVGSETMYRNSLSGRKVTGGVVNPVELMDALDKALGPKLAKKVTLIYSDEMKQQGGEGNTKEIKSAGILRGRYNKKTGQVFVFLDGVDSIAQAVWTAWHELFHRGFDNLTGNILTREFLTNADFAMHKKLLSDAGTNPIVKQIADFKRNAGYEGYYVPIEEALVELGAAFETRDFARLKAKYGVTIPADMMGEVQSLTQRFIALLKRIFFGQKMSNAKIYDLIGKMRESLELDHRAETGEFISSRLLSTQDELAFSRDFTKDGESSATIEGINSFIKETIPERSVEQLLNLINRRRKMLANGIKYKPLKAAVTAELKMLTEELNRRSARERFSSRGAFHQPARNLTPAQIAQWKADVLSWVRDRLGPQFNVLFETEASIGAVGRYNWETSTIRLAIEQAGNWGAAHHEAFHAFFHTMGKVDSQRRVYDKLLAAASSPHVRRQLRKLLAGEETALAQLTDPEERLAYMFQFYMSKELTLRGPVRQMLKDLVKKLGKLVGYISKMDVAEDIFKSFKAGKLTDYYSIRAKLSQVQSKGAAKVWEDAYIPVKDAMKAVLKSSINRLRETNNLALREIADLFYRDPKTGGPSGFLANRGQKEAQFRNRLREIFSSHGVKPRDARVGAALKELQSQTATNQLSPIARDIRLFLRELYTYLADEVGVMEYDGLDVNGDEIWLPLNDAGELYFPRVWDPAAVLANWTDFVAQVQRDSPNTTAADLEQFRLAMERGEGMSEMNSLSPDFNPAMRAIKLRRFSFINSTNAGAYAKWQKQDLVDIMTTYVRQAAHRGENTRSFGPKDDKLDELLKRAKEEGATPKQMAMAKKVIKGLKGTLGNESMTPAKRNAMVVAMTLVNFAVLPLAIFSSLVDPLGVLVRTGSMKGAATTFLEGIKQIGRDISGNRSQMEKIAELLGIIEEEQMLTIIGDSYHGMFMNSALKKINDTFFKAIGLDSWTKGTRIGAMAAGMLYLRDNATNAAVLKELGLKPGDIVMQRPRNHRGQYITNVQPTVVAFTPQELGGDVAKAQRVQAALNRMVDESILRPTAAQRPVFMSDARFMLLGHLKQFTFSFHNTIVNQVRGNVVKNLDNQEYVKAAQGLLPLLSYVPFMLGADMIRAMVAGRWDDDDDRELEEYVWDAVQRSAILGYGTFAMDAVDDLAFGGLPTNTFLGPVIHKGLRLGEAAVDPDERFVNEAIRLLPGYALWKGYLE